MGASSSQSKEEPVVEPQANQPKLRAELPDRVREKLYILVNTNKSMLFYAIPAMYEMIFNEKIPFTGPLIDFIDRQPFLYRDHSFVRIATAQDQLKTSPPGMASLTQQQRIELLLPGYTYLTVDDLCRAYKIAYAHDLLPSFFFVDVGNFVQQLPYLETGPHHLVRYRRTTATCANARTGYAAAGLFRSVYYEPWESRQSQAVYATPSTSPRSPAKPSTATPSSVSSTKPNITTSTSSSTKPIATATHSAPSAKPNLVSAATSTNTKAPQVSSVNIPTPSTVSPINPVAVPVNPQIDDILITSLVSSDAVPITHLVNLFKERYGRNPSLTTKLSLVLAKNRCIQLSSIGTTVSARRIPLASGSLKCAGKNVDCDERS